MRFLKTYFSPFKPLKMKWYVGEVAVGVPYFYPRRTVKDKDRPGYLKFVSKKVGFDFVDLGWKTKWTPTDYRFEWSPVWSFVFFKWQIAVAFIAPEMNHYWECWLYYENNTDKSLPTLERLTQARDRFPCIWTKHVDGVKEKVCYWDEILKDKYARKQDTVKAN